MQNSTHGLYNALQQPRNKGLSQMRGMLRQARTPLVARAGQSTTRGAPPAPSDESIRLTLLGTHIRGPAITTKSP